MNKNPAKVGSRHYYQGYYECKNPNKYIGEDKRPIYRSSWERKLCYKFDHSKEILAWTMEYPIPYISPKDGLPHRYFVDFLTVAIDENGKKIVSLIEVKPEKEKYPPKKQGKKKQQYLRECMTYEINQAKWEYARKYCKQKGWQFIILSEVQILGKK